MATTGTVSMGYSDHNPTFPASHKRRLHALLDILSQTSKLQITQVVREVVSGVSEQVVSVEEETQLLVY